MKVGAMKMSSRKRDTLKKEVAVVAVAAQGVHAREID